MLPGGGRVAFTHRLGSGSYYYGSCDRVEAGEGVELSASWADATGVLLAASVVWSSDMDVAFYSAQPRSVALWLTPPAGGHSVLLRWQQLKHSGAGWDGWMLDDLQLDSQCE